MNTVALTNENFKDEVLSCDMPVLVDFYADWCGPCKMLAPIIEEIAREYPSIKVVKLDIGEADEVATEYDVQNIPTVILFKNGEEQSRIVGLKQKESIIRELSL